MRSSISGRAAIVPEEYPDAYAVVRALLTDRGADGCQLATEHSEQILLRHMQAKATPSSTLAEEAEHHGIAPLIAPAIEALSRKRPDLVDDAVHWTFVALASRHRAAAAAREQCIEALLEAFDTAGIRLVLLKGAVLAHRIYSPELRPMLDIDVLTEPQHTERAIAIARSLGYTFASGYASRFSGRLHHLPEATMDRAGFRMSLEIHLDALSRDQPERLTLATLSGPTITFRRGSGREGMALGHIDMLRHLTRHAFEPARRIRLIHLYDIWRYQAVFAGEIDREQLASRFPGVCVVLGLVASVFSPRGGALDPCNDQSRPTPAGVGCGMVPLSEILAGDDGLGAKLNALFDPPAWWLHGFYRVPAGRSLLACRTIRHPANVARWLTRRLAAGVGSLAAAEARPSGTTAPCSPSGASLTTR